MKLGGFNKEFFMYYEDTDLSFKLLRNGYKIRLISLVPTGNWKGLKDKYTDKLTVHKSNLFRMFFGSNVWINNFMFGGKVNGRQVIAESFASRISNHRPREFASHLNGRDRFIVPFPFNRSDMYIGENRSAITNKHAF